MSEQQGYTRSLISMFLVRFLAVLVASLLFAISTPSHPPTALAQTAHCGTLSGNETWSASVHVVTCDVVVPNGMVLTISSGAIVKFQARADILVDGKIHALGTTTQPIYFTSYRDDSIAGDTNNDGPSAGAVGDWGLIQFNSGSDDSSIITRSVIRYSGSDAGNVNDGAIRLFNASPNLSYITFTDNFINGVEIPGGTWQTDTWDNETIIYVQTGDVTVPAANTLTITAGKILKLINLADIYVDGKFLAVGTSENPIRFSSYLDDTLCGTGAFGEAICDTHQDGPSAGAVGDWGLIQFNSGSDDSSTITRSVIRYSGSDAGNVNDGAIRLFNASPNLSYITFTDNFINGVEIPGGTWQTDTWDNETIIYIQTGNVTIPAANTLTIRPGKMLKLVNRTNFYIDGKLLGVGTSESPIYFSSYLDDTLCGTGAFDEAICDSHQDGSSAGAVGDWGLIAFNSGSDDSSSISHAVIRFGGNEAGTTNDGAIRLDDASPTISFTRLIQGFRGLEMLGDSYPTLECNDIYDNLNFGVFNGNSASVVNAENTWWGSDTGPTHSGNPGGTGQYVSDGVDYTPWATYSCLLDKAPKPGIPTLISPADGASTTSSTVRFEWAAAQHADEYAIEVWGPGGPYKSGRISQTAWTQSLPPGDFWWYVEAYCDEARCSQTYSGWSEKWNLSVVEIPTPTPTNTFTPTPTSTSTSTPTSTSTSTPTPTRTPRPAPVGTPTPVDSVYLPTIP